MNVQKRADPVPWLPSIGEYKCEYTERFIILACSVSLRTRGSVRIDDLMVEYITDNLVWNRDYRESVIT